MKENVNKQFQNFIDESLRFAFNINAICKMWAGQVLNVRDKSCDIYANGKLLGSERWNKWGCEKEKGYLVRDGDWVFHAKEQAAQEKNQAQKEPGRKSVQESRNKNGMILTETSHKYSFFLFVVFFFFPVLDFEIHEPSQEHSQYG